MTLKTHIVTMLLNGPPITRAHMVRKLWTHITSVNEFDEILKEFKEADMIVESHDGKLDLTPRTRIELERLLYKTNKPEHAPDCSHWASGECDCGYAGV